MIKRIVIILYLLIILTACTSTKYVEVPVESIKTEYVNKIQYDSIYIHDSIDRYISNDTVYVIKYKTSNKYHTLVDTIYKTDSISIPVIQEVTTIKEVNKLTMIQKSFMILGMIVTLFVGVKIILQLNGKFK